jgi:hypothetical protein
MNRDTYLRPYKKGERITTSALVAIVDNVFRLVLRLIENLVRFS